MSLISHKGEIIPIKNIVIPAPNGSALFHFDHHLVGTGNGNIIQPNEGHVATLRYGEGIFGGAVAVEEDTTNVTSSGSDYGDFENGGMTTFSTYNNGSGAGIVVTRTVVSADAEGIPRPPNGSEYVMKIHVDNSVNNGSNTGWYYLGTYTAGKTYTQSAYMLIPEDCSIGYVNNAGITNTKIVLPPPSMSKWQRYTRTFTVGENNYSNGLHFYAKKNGVFSFYMDMHQIEEKPFATSFVKGSRSVGYIRYENVLTPPTSSGTVSFWWRSPHKLQRDDIGESGQTTYPKVCQLGSYTSPRNLVLWLWNKELRFFIGDTSGSNWDRNPTLVDAEELDPDTWYHLTISWDNKRYRFYLNGQMRYDETRPNSFDQWADNSSFKIEQNASAHPNALYDELIILPYAASDDEVLSWYESKAPFVDLTTPLGVAL